MFPKNTFFISPKVGIPPSIAFSLPIPLRVRETRSKTEPAKAENQYSELSLSFESQERAATGKSGQKVSERRSVQTLSRFKLEP